MQQQTQTKTEFWALIELFGHAKIAGKVSEQTIGGCSFLRVDVPSIDDQPAFTRLFGQGAIYSITVTDEQTATAAARHWQPRPMDTWTIAEVARQLPGRVEHVSSDDDDFTAPADSNEGRYA